MYKLLVEINRSQLMAEEKFNCFLLSLSGYSNKKVSAGQPSAVTRHRRNSVSKSNKAPPTICLPTFTSKPTTFMSKMLDCSAGQPSTQTTSSRNRLKSKGASTVHSPTVTFKKNHIKHAG